MSRIERLLWTGAGVTSAVLVLYIMMLPEEEGRALWNGSDPVVSGAIGIAILAGCALWAWRMTGRRDEP